MSQQDNEETYCIVRFYKDAGHKRTIIKTGLTLQEAKEHCSDPETDSKTSTQAFPAGALENQGPWFDGFEKE